MTKLLITDALNSPLVKSTESQVVNPEYYNIPGYQPIPRYYEENDGITITNPDSGLSIREMIEKYVRGEEVQGHPVYYDDDENNIVPQNFDLSDLTAAESVIEASNQDASSQASANGPEGQDQDGPGVTPTGDSDGQRPADDATSAAS